MTIHAASRVAVASRSFSRNEELRRRLLGRFPHVTFNDAGKALRGEELVSFLAGHDRAIIALETIDGALLARLPELKIISKYGVGFDSLDLAAMRSHGVRLGWTGGVNRRAVSELVIAFAITMLREMPRAFAETREGRWPQVVGAQLTGKTVGIVGLGHVGKDLAQMLQAFQCRVLANDIVPFPEFCARFNVEQVPLDRLLAVSDIVTLHVPLDGTTRGFFDAGRLRSMKPRSYLINAARGGLLDEAALLEALNSGHIAGAALDVFAVEPPETNALLHHPRALVTPHIGGSSSEAILAMGQAAIDGLENSREVTDGFP